MALVDKFKKICIALGKNNKPTYAVMAIATVKGICRPTFTMMDKTEKPETKKYTAIREGLTELIAIPAYWICGEATSHLSKLMVKGSKKEDFLSQTIKDSIKNGANDVKVQKAMKNAEYQLEELTKHASNNMRFIGVCAAALFIIPALCSAAIKPLMGRLIKQPQAVENNKLSLKPQPQASITNFGTKRIQPLKTYNSTPNLGMKVGGV